MKETWEDRASKAKVKGWMLLHAAMKCFELGEIADAKAKAEKCAPKPTPDPEAK